MVLTKSYIDELTRDFSTEAIRFNSRFKEEDIPLQITEENLQYLITKLCDMREELDNLYDERKDMGAMYVEMLND